MSNYLYHSVKHRLAAFVYRDDAAVAVTCCTKEKYPVFVNESLVMPARDVLLREAEKHICCIHAFVFMPDHCHFIIQGTAESADPLTAVKRFKQKSGYLLKHLFHRDIWQASYYDHILHSQDDLERQVRYILNNPVRKGIVSDWQSYPFKGSTVYNLDEWK